MLKGFMMILLFISFQIVLIGALFVLRVMLNLYFDIDYIVVIERWMKKNERQG